MNVKIELEIPVSILKRIKNANNDNYEGCAIIADFLASTVDHENALVDSILELDLPKPEKVGRNTFLNHGFTIKFFDDTNPGEWGHNRWVVIPASSDMWLGTFETVEEAVYEIDEVLD